MSSGTPLKKRSSAQITENKGATVAEEKKKLLQQYQDDDGHFSLVR
jgi:CDP-diacylglycerol--serine O-phosphatidyltransferase